MIIFLEQREHLLGFLKYQADFVNEKCIKNMEEKDEEMPVRSIQV